MVVIPPPDPDRTTILSVEKAFPPRPVITYTDEGAGDIDLVCGSCDNVLVKSAQNANLVAQLVIKCPVCDSHNETRV